MLILGIDIGGTTLKAALVNTVTGEITGEKLRVATPSPSTPEALLDALVGIVKHFKHTGPVGVGFPGVIQSGAIATAANFEKSLIGVRLGDELKKRAGVTAVSLVNDADAAGLGEAAFGGIPSSSGVVIVLTLGTGIGGAIIHNGKLVPNFEPGHWEILNPNGPGEIDAEWTLSAVNREKLGQSWEQWAAAFGDFLRQIHKAMWPEAFVLGGGGAGGAAHFLPHQKAPCPVHIARRGNDAGIIGAALAAK